MKPQIATRFVLALLVVLTSACAAAVQGGSASAPLVSSLQVETFPDSVRFALQVTNPGPGTVTLDFPTGQSFDFLVARGGTEVWRWSADQVFTQALRTESLAPGETRTFTAAWEPPAGTRGDFVARGFLTARGTRAEQQAQFRLP
jgi:hypothetical protein